MKKLLIAISALALFGLMACEGPAGPAGKDGAAGAQGPAGQNAGFVYFDGFKADLKCATCHTPDSDTAKFVNARRIEYESSGHMEGTAWARGLNSTSCAACHITEGHLESARGDYATMATKSYPNGTKPGCFTCHSPHAKGDFTMRKTTAINIKSFVVGAPDISFNVGTSNACVTCHRTRETSPMSVIPDPTKTAATDSIVITSSRFYPHYGVQGQILVGKGGFEFAGYSYPSSYHTQLANAKNIQCQDCHMATPSVVVEGKTVAGGHSFRIGYKTSSTDTIGSVNVAGCRASGCHTDVTSNTMTKTAFKAYRSAQKDVAVGMDTLRALLVAKGWLNPATDLANASTSKPLVIKPAYRAGALFNYFFLEHEGSHGIHNTKYAKALLDASIAELKK